MALFSFLTAWLSPPPISKPNQRYKSSLLSWPAWRRVLAVLPVLLLLWLAVAWASQEAA